jgi:hypothetical protein
LSPSRWCLSPIDVDGVLQDDDIPNSRAGAITGRTTSDFEGIVVIVAPEGGGGNQIPLRELLDALQYQYGPILTNDPIDYAVPKAAVTALSRFCRVAPRAVQMLDLRERLPRVASAMLLRFDKVSSYCPRHTRRRVRYSFCPACLVEQKVIHVRWDWSLSCLIRCAVHRRPLLEGCPLCSEPDPLTFTGSGAPSCLRCRSCEGSLVGTNHEMGGRDDDMEPVEDAYRAALAGAPPGLLKKATDCEFRLFVEEMFDVLAHSLNGSSNRRTTFSRLEILGIIATLILDAAPCGNKFASRSPGTQGKHLWATLVSLIPAYLGVAIEKQCLRWPAPLRRGYLSGLHYRKGKRWPSTPYRDPAVPHRPTVGADIARLYGLRPLGSDSSNGLSSI